MLCARVSKLKKADEPLSNDLKVLQGEMVKLKAELRPTTEERDILKKRPQRTLQSRPSEVAFIQAHKSEFNLTNIAISSVHMSLSGSVRLRRESCLGIWGNANFYGPQSCFGAEQENDLIAQPMPSGCKIGQCDLDLLWG